MPTYEYKCPQGHVFTSYQFITAEPLSTCPDHPGAAVVRLIGAGSPPIFKGSGFYCNDRKDRKGTPS